MGGNFVIDDEHLAKHHGITDFASYQCDPSVPESELTLDFFLPSYTPEQVDFGTESNYFAAEAQGGNQTQSIVQKIAEKMPALKGKGKGVCRLEIVDVVKMELDLLNGAFATEPDAVVSPLATLTCTEENLLAMA